MPFIQLEQDLIRDLISLIVSPAAEMLNGLHVLADPSHHLSNRDWAAAVLSDLPQDLRVEVEYFARYCDGWLNAGDLLHIAGSMGAPVPVFLRQLEGLPPERVFSVCVPLTRDRSHVAGIDHCSFAARLVGVLDRYWKEHFAAEWERRRPLLERRHAEEASRLDGMPALDWLVSLHGRISYDHERAELVFHKAEDLRFALGELESIVCIPSTFTAPHMMIGYVERELAIYLNVAAPVSSPGGPPPELLGVAKALADETRLLIYKATLKRAQYTQELAAAMGLAEPTVSRHLKVLRSAGLVTSRKEGGVVLYTGLLDPVDRLPAVFREFLRG